MYIVSIDGKDVGSMKDLHDGLMEQLQLPAYYGRNLDALWDVLSTWHEPIHFDVINHEKLLEKLGKGGASFLRLMMQVAIENPRITMDIDEET